jgi:hypothetical protein
MSLIDALKQRLLGTVRAGRSSRRAGLPSLEVFAEDVETVLRHIDFEEVTTDDKVTFVELAVDSQVRNALERGRFDRAVELRRYGAERIARLHLESNAGGAIVNPQSHPRR